MANFHGTFKKGENIKEKVVSKCPTNVELLVQKSALSTMCDFHDFGLT